MAYPPLPPCYISHAMSPMRYLTSHMSYHRHHGIFIITNMIYIPHGISKITNMIYIPCGVSHVKPYMACHIIPFHISHSIFHTIFIMAYISLPTIFFLPCHISHAISYMSCHIIPCYFSHFLYHNIIYLLFHTFCNTFLVPYVPVLFLRYCLSFDISCAIYHVIHHWCHIYGAIYACIVSKLWYHMVYIHLCCHISSTIIYAKALLQRYFKHVISHLPSIMFHLASDIYQVTYI
jgi:hypothetical protein